MAGNTIYIDDEEFDDAAIRGASADLQHRIMREWFFQNYEDPANSLPYESAEGGYQWIYGGPCDAEEVLSERFDGIVSEGRIDKLCDDLERLGPLWTPIPDPADLEWGSEGALPPSEQLGRFVGAVLDLEGLLALSPSNHLRVPYCRMLFASVITALETFLGEVFQSAVLADDDSLARFFERTPAFQSRNVSMASVPGLSRQLEAIARQQLDRMVWHRAERVAKMFSDVLEVQLSKEATDRFKEAVKTRNDIVHRNGRTREGTEVEVLEPEVRSVLEFAEFLARLIESELANRHGDRGASGASLPDTERADGDR